MRRKRGGRLLFSAGDYVFEYFYAGEVFSGVGFCGLQGCGVGGVEAGDVVSLDAKVIGEIDGTFVLESLGDYDEGVDVIFLYGIFHRFDRAISLAVENNVCDIDTVSHEGVSHTLDFVYAVETVLISAYKDLFDLTGLVEVFRRVDAINEEVIFQSCIASMRSSAEQQTILHRLHLVDIGSSLLLGIVGHSEVTTEEQGKAEHYPTDEPP